jgi:hypothetical protein
VQDQIHVAAVEPWNEGVPRIHGPDIYGASAHKPFLYAVPATGERPMRFAAEGLPDGLRVDAASGHITGSAAQDGECRVLVRAENRHGRAEKELRIVVGAGLALTPPMGWNSWNAWRRWVADDKIRAAADGLVNTGLAARGYSYVNIDSCWQGDRGGRHNAIQPNRKFPDMGALAGYLHARGLKFGIYSTPWTVPWGCSEQEAREEWGGGRLIGSSSGAPDPDHLPSNISGRLAAPHRSWCMARSGHVRSRPAVRHAHEQLPQQADAGRADYAHDGVGALSVAAHPELRSRRAE